MYKSLGNESITSNSNPDPTTEPQSDPNANPSTSADPTANPDVHSTHAPQPQPISQGPALYALVTDDVFLHEPSIVWERLEDVDGGASWFVDSEFHRAVPIGGDVAGQTAEGALRRFELEAGLGVVDPLECVFLSCRRRCGKSGIDRGTVTLSQDRCKPRKTNTHARCTCAVNKPSHDAARSRRRRSGGGRKKVRGVSGLERVKRERIVSSCRRPCLEFFFLDFVWRIDEDRVASTWLRRYGAAKEWIETCVSDVISIRGRESLCPRKKVSWRSRQRKLERKGGGEMARVLPLIGTEAETRCSIFKCLNIRRAREGVSRPPGTENEQHGRIDTLLAVELAARTVRASTWAYDVDTWSER